MDKSTSKVNQMFASIAERYDLTNDVLSFGMHRLWENKVISQLASPSSAKCLDLCTGTGALLPRLLDRFESVVAADICPEMLDIAAAKFKIEVTKGRLKIDCADALSLPYPTDSFDVITIAYGVRNFENLQQGLNEVRRVLKPEGELVVLEFGQPTGLIAPFYKFYAKYIMPLLGGILTGNKAAYQYLPKTAGTFTCGDEFIQKLEFDVQEYKVTKLLGGIAYIYLIR